MPLLWKDKLEKDLQASQKFIWPKQLIWPKKPLDVETSVDLLAWDRQALVWTGATTTPSRLEELQFDLDDTTPTPNLELPDTWFSFIPQAQAGGLNDEEKKLMQQVKAQGWSREDGEEILQQFRAKQQPQDQVQEIDKIEQPEEEISGLDIWVKAWKAISWVW